MYVEAKDAAGVAWHEPIIVQALDEPIINPISAGLTSQLDLPIRLVVAFVAGLALAFALDYIDPAIYDRDEVDTLGLEILGEIPKK